MQRSSTKRDNFLLVHVVTAKKQTSIICVMQVMLSLTDGKLMLLWTLNALYDTHIKNVGRQ